MAKKDKFQLNNFHPQAYLMFLAGYSAGSLAKSKLAAQGGKNVLGVHKLVGRYNPQAVMSKVYNAKDSSGNKLIKANFFNLETHKISALVPELRFYKVEGEIFTPFYFPVSVVSDTAASLDQPARLRGSGVKSFSVDFMGTDPFTAPKYLKATMDLYVENIANLFDVSPGYAPLVDLFTISIAGSTTKKSPNGSTLTSGDFARPIEIAVTLGYVIPSNRMGIFTQEEIKEIQSSNLSIRMNVIQHTINVNQNGSANIAIEYTARIDNAIRNRIYSAVDNPIDVLKRANIYQLLSATEKNLESKGKKKDKEPPESVRKSQLRKAIEIRKVMNFLEETNRIHSVLTNKEYLLTYNKLGIDLLDKEATEHKTDPESDIENPGTPSPPGASLESEQSKSIEESIKEMDSSVRRVYYVTFGDLLDSFFEKAFSNLTNAQLLLQKSSQIESIDFLSKTEEERLSISKSLAISEMDLADLHTFSQKSKDEKEKINKTLQDAITRLGTFRVLLADVEFTNYSETASAGSTDVRMNLADIPISLETYQQFMFDKIINSYRNSYTVTSFIEDCVSSLLPSAFGKEWANAGIASRVVDSAPQVTSVNYSGPDLRKSLKKRKQIDPVDVPSGQKNFRASNIKDEADYVVIHQAVDRSLARDGSGKVDEDSKNGVYHFLLGKDRGLIKEISFSRFDVPFAQEQLMTNQVGTYDELKMPYNASISMVGNNLFLPGSQIFINPSNIGFGSPTDLESPAFKIGLGGYYTILGVTTTFNGSTLDTKIECSFGSHARDRVGLTGIAGEVKKISDIEMDRESNDSEPGDIPDLNSGIVEVQQSHYLEQLSGLRDPRTGNQVLDSTTARRISNDYILQQENNDVSIPGVVDKTINPSTGAVRYNLDKGQTIEINDTNPASSAVKLVSV